MINEELTVMSFPYPGGYEKTVRVFVPEHEAEETFPVIYMSDGQNLFYEKDVKFGCWHTMEAVREEMKKSGKGAVIVGIHNDGHPMQRTNELSPAGIGEFRVPPGAPEELSKMLAPSGEMFDEFVLNTVMPAIEKKFPVKTGRENTAFCGSSSGGLQCFYMVLSHPDIFGTGGIFSPCFMAYPPDDLERWINSKVSEDKPLLYIYSGGAEGLEAFIMQSVEYTYSMLQKVYPSERIIKVIKPENPHHESAWETEFRNLIHVFLN